MFDQTGEFFANHRTHAAAHKAEVHDTQAMANYPVDQYRLNSIY
jgi:hypothetical protein